MMWANFFKGTKKASMKETLNGPTGIHPARNGKLPTPINPCGFHYHNSRKRRALGPAQATAAPTGTELQQEDTLKTPIAKKKLDVLLPVEVTPEINDESMQGHLESDFDDNEPASTLGVPASCSPAKKGEQLCEELFNDNVLTDIEQGRRDLKPADMKQLRRLRSKQRRLLRQRRLRYCSMRTKP